MKRSQISIGAVLAVLAFASLSEARFEKRNQVREQHQQARIREGVQSGELTRHEAKKLRYGQKKVDHMQNKFSQDGDLSASEKFRLEKAQDRQNRHIWKQKHDGQQRDAASTDSGG